ncbi:MAG: hypothetical protein ABFD89_08040 [Bryobacteraceae bacterium]
MAYEQTITDPYRGMEHLLPQRRIKEDRLEIGALTAVTRYGEFMLVEDPNFNESDIPAGGNWRP